MTSVTEEWTRKVATTARDADRKRDMQASSRRSKNNNNDKTNRPTRQQVIYRRNVQLHRLRLQQQNVHLIHRRQMIIQLQQQRQRQQHQRTKKVHQKTKTSSRTNANNSSRLSLLPRKDWHRTDVRNVPRIMKRNRPWQRLRSIPHSNTNNCIIIINNNNS